MKICLITPGQPSTDPRLVKEADALTGAGYEVRVLCAHWAPWAFETDELLLASRSWSCAYVGGDPVRRGARYRWTRLRHGISRRVPAAWRWNARVRGWALCRVLPELMRAAKTTVADLYVAHSLGALSAAVHAAAAQKYKARVGFDAEDFHSGERSLGAARSVANGVAEYFERRYLPQCNYITASSPGIADAYTVKYRIPRPVPILNVFPLSHRPREFRLSKPSAPMTLYWFSQTIGPNRGLEDIVQALGVLRNQNIELHLRGSWQPGYRQQLFECAARAGLNSEQITGHSPALPDEMVRLAAQYDVGLALEQHVSENREICLTNKIFTYLLAGNAVIATATKGQRAIVERLGPAGFCYEPGDVEMLAGGLRWWYEDRTALQEARREAWDWGTQEYNWDLEKEKFLQVVETVLLSGSNH